MVNENEKENETEERISFLYAEDFLLHRMIHQQHSQQTTKKINKLLLLLLNLVYYQTTSKKISSSPMYTDNAKNTFSTST